MKTQCCESNVNQCQWLIVCVIININVAMKKAILVMKTSIKRRKLINGNISNDNDNGESVMKTIVINDMYVK